MVIEVENNDENDAFNVMDGNEVGCHGKDVQGTADKLLEELRMEFASLRSLTDFNRNGGKVEPISASLDRIVCEMTVGPEDVNGKGTMHGGQTATLTDIITARAVGLRVKDRAMSSIELSVSYLLPVALGEIIEITAQVLKLGRNVAFTEAEFRRKSDGKLASKGRHTLAILPKQRQEDGSKIAQY